MTGQVKRIAAVSDPEVRILDDLVVNQIAAGEVVERPASVVKELVENSIDSGASKVVVGVVTGGRARITVKDNGCGMSASNALVAIKRFGTSKISKTSDLLEISSMGFRGEALPSIAAVSRFSLRSQSSEGEGVLVSLAGGEKPVVEHGSQVLGTTITVEDLFFNVPARKKFLKTDKTELGYIKSVVHDLASANPAIRFELVSEGKTVITLPAVETFVERAGQIVGKSTDFISIKDLLQVESGPYQVEGLVGKPLNSARGANKLRLLVNGRAVRDKLMLRAVREGYGNMLKPGQYPVGIVSLKVPPLDVDINVHPQKSEVRFRLSSEVFKVIARSVKRAITDESTGFHAGLSSRQDFSEQQAVVPFKRREVSSEAPRFFESGFLEKEQQDAQAVIPAVDPSLPQTPFKNAPTIGKQEPELLSDMRYVGQVFKCYLLFEGRDVFSILDMHAAHEIIKFVEIKENLQSGKVAIQQLLVPVTVELEPFQYDCFTNCSDELRKLGLDCDIFGDSSVAVRGTPAPLGQLDPEELLREMLDLASERSLISDVEKAWDDIIARMACHGSIRSGRELKREEAESLVSSLETTKGSAFCPHGRPVVQFFTKNELEDRFGRLG